MPESEAHESNRARAKPQQEPRQRVPTTDLGQATPGLAADMQELQQPWGSLLGSDFSQRTFERHAALLGDSRMSHSMYRQQRAMIVQQLQRDYGNQYVQRLVKHISQQPTEPVQRKQDEQSRGVDEPVADRISEHPSGPSISARQSLAQREEADRAFLEAAIQRFKDIDASPGGFAGQRDVYHPWEALLPPGLIRGRTSAPITRTNPTTVQAKLTVGPAGDKYEQEADRVAKQVAGMTEPSAQRLEELEEEEIVQAKPDGSAQRQGELAEEELQMKPLVQRQPVEEEEEAVQMQPAQPQIGLEGGDIAPEVEQSIQKARGQGSPLPENVRAPMENAFGADFSGVRVHAGAEAEALNASMSARAFTTGQDIFFRQGDYNPDSKPGKETIAHELTHVVQQSGTGMPPETKVTGPLPTDPLIQRDIDTVVSEQEIQRYPYHKSPVQSKRREARPDLKMKPPLGRKRRSDNTAPDERSANLSVIQRLVVGTDEVSIEDAIERLLTQYYLVESPKFNLRNALGGLEYWEVEFNTWDDLVAELLKLGGTQSSWFDPGAYVVSYLAKQGIRVKRDQISLYRGFKGLLSTYFSSGVPGPIGVDNIIITLTDGKTVELSKIVVSLIQLQFDPDTAFFSTAHWEPIGLSIKNFTIGDINLIDHKAEGGPQTLLNANVSFDTIHIGKPLGFLALTAAVATSVEELLTPQKSGQGSGQASVIDRFTDALHRHVKELESMSVDVGSIKLRVNSVNIGGVTEAKGEVTLSDLQISLGYKDLPPISFNIGLDLNALKDFGIDASGTAEIVSNQDSLRVTLPGANIRWSKMAGKTVTLDEGVGVIHNLSWTTNIADLGKGKIGKITLDEIDLNSIKLAMPYTTLEIGLVVKNISLTAGTNLPDLFSRAILQAIDAQVELEKKLPERAKAIVQSMVKILEPQIRDRLTASTGLDVGELRVKIASVVVDGMRVVEKDEVTFSDLHIDVEGGLRTGDINLSLKTLKAFGIDASVKVATAWIGDSLRCTLQSAEIGWIKMAGKTVTLDKGVGVIQDLSWTSTIADLRNGNIGEITLSKIVLNSIKLTMPGKTLEMGLIAENIRLTAATKLPSLFASALLQAIDEQKELEETLPEEAVAIGLGMLPKLIGRIQELLKARARLRVGTLDVTFKTAADVVEVNLSDLEINVGGGVLKTYSDLSLKTLKAFGIDASVNMTVARTGDSLRFTLLRMDIAWSKMAGKNVTLDEGVGVIQNLSWDTTIADLIKGDIGQITLGRIELNSIKLTMPGKTLEIGLIAENISLKAATNLPSLFASALLQAIYEQEELKETLPEEAVAIGQSILPKLKQRIQGFTADAGLHVGTLQLRIIGFALEAEGDAGLLLGPGINRVQKRFDRTDVTVDNITLENADLVTTLQGLTLKIGSLKIGKITVSGTVGEEHVPVGLEASLELSGLTLQGSGNILSLIASSAYDAFTAEGPPQQDVRARLAELSDTFKHKLERNVNENLTGTAGVTLDSLNVTDVVASYGALTAGGSVSAKDLAVGVGFSEGLEGAKVSVDEASGKIALHDAFVKLGDESLVDIRSVDLNLDDRGTGSVNVAFVLQFGLATVLPDLLRPLIGNLTNAVEPTTLSVLIEEYKVMLGGIELKIPNHPKIETFLKEYLLNNIRVSDKKTGWRRLRRGEGETTLRISGGKKIPGVDPRLRLVNLTQEEMGVTTEQQAENPVLITKSDGGQGAVNLKAFVENIIQNKLRSLGESVTKYSAPSAWEVSEETQQLLDELSEKAPSTWEGSEEQQQLFDEVLSEFAPSTSEEQQVIEAPGAPGIEAPGAPGIEARGAREPMSVKETLRVIRKHLKKLTNKLLKKLFSRRRRREHPFNRELKNRRARTREYEHPFNKELKNRRAKTRIEAPKLNWKFKTLGSKTGGSKPMTGRQLRVGGLAFQVGHASGSDLNCLIHSLQQAVGEPEDLLAAAVIRQALETAALAVRGEYVENDRDVVDFILVFLGHQGRGVNFVAGNTVDRVTVPGTNPVWIAHVGGNHFVPLTEIQQRRAPATSGVAPSTSEEQQG